MGVSSSVDGVPAFSRRATASATERSVFIAKGPASSGSGNAEEFEHRTTRYYWRLGARAATEREASEAGRGAAPRALLNGLVASAKQEHPRGEGSNSMNSVVGILRLNSTWALCLY